MDSFTDQATSPFMPIKLPAKQPDELYRMRITYRKRGRLRLLSHLEVMRALERTVRRAQLPFAVTQGFSPHMKTSFGSALPVGVGGKAEMFDVYLARFLDPTRALENLRASSVADLQVESCEYVDVRAAAPNIAFPVSVYEAELDRRVEGLQVPETIVVVRKKKERELIVADFLLQVPTYIDDILDRPTLEFALHVKQDGSLRPDVFVDALLAGSGAEVVSLTRVRQLPDIFAL